LTALAPRPPSRPQVLIDRKKWIEMGEECEKAAAPLTAACIIRHVIGLGVDREDRKRTWLADAEVCGAVYTCAISIPHPTHTRTYNVQTHAHIPARVQSRMLTFSHTRARAHTRNKVASAGGEGWVEGEGRAEVPWNGVGCVRWVLWGEKGA
jgi:hypothetical protein